MNESQPFDHDDLPAALRLHGALQAAYARLLALLLPLAVFGVALLCGQTARAANASASAAPRTPWAEAVRQLAEEQLPDAASARHGSATGALRVDVEVGTLDSRLRLAPCRRIEPQWPTGVKPWGRIRVPMRCVDGPVAWKVYLPVTVKVFGAAVVAAADLPAGTELTIEHLALAEVDLAAKRELPLRQAAALPGRVLARPVKAGQSLHEADLRQRQWFAAGDPVRVVAVGSGFSVSGEGVAVTPGLEGQPSRVRTSTGRIVVGRAVGDRRLEVAP